MISNRETLGRTKVAHYPLESYIALAKVYDGMWADGSADMRRRMVGMSKLMRRYATMYPIGKPAALLIRGWLASHDGKPARAAKLYRAAHRALATRAGLDDAARAQHMAQADALEAS